MQQTTITLKVCEETKRQMMDFFIDLKREKTPPYAVFQAKDGDTVVTLYESGKAVFQGKDADLASAFWIETEKINNGSAVTTDSREKEKKKVEKILPIRINSIGSDEVGTGDYFGPVVVTASYVSKDNIDFLLDLKVKDSKKLSDEQIIQIVPKIIQRIPYQTFVLKNKEYNLRKSENMNMNQMKAILHNKVLYELKSKNYPYQYIVVDQFEPAASYYKHIHASTKKVNDIFFLTKAEDQCLSVACSSLISRYIFLKEMNSLSKEIGMNLPKGAGPMVDEVAKKVVEKYGKEKLNEIAKLNFKNTDKILSNI
ncbi:MAG: ribonuclease HIII [Bacilli bacterium]|nr:ribonuclease HIII [Bacilli bacterium]